MRLELVTAGNIAEIQQIMAEPDTDVSMRGMSLGEQTDIVQLLIRSDNNAVGYVNFHLIDMISRTAFIAMFIREPCRPGLKDSSGIYKDLIEYAWNTLNLRKLYADTFKKPVAHFLERTGWVLEGCLKESKYIDGRYVNHCIYVLDRK